MSLHVGRPNVGNEALFLEHVRSLLDRRWFSNDGPLVQEFERQLCELTGARHCIAMCNATIALEIAVRGLGLRGEVIIPAYTFVATAHCLQWQEITPVFCDIDPVTHNLDPVRIERLITPRTTGIIGVHVWGRPCNVSAIGAIARRHGLKVMYDAAHALANSYQGRMIGNFGDCEVFSFHATKFINSFEGGAVATNDDDLADRLRLMRNFGFAGLDRVIYVGTNGKMPEICAAMGLSSLAAIDDIVGKNRANWTAYRSALHGIDGFNLITFPEGNKANCQYVVAEIDPDVCPLTRDELVAVLHAENVLARKYFWPGVHRMEPYRSLQPNASLLVPETERLAARVIVLPNGPAVDQASIEQIGVIVRSATGQYREIRKRLTPAE